MVAPLPAPASPDDDRRPSLPEELRRRLQSGRQLIERQREASLDEGRGFPTTLPTVDRLLDGGLGRGETVEVVGRRTSGRFSLVLATLAAATRSGEAAALVDLGDGFDPQGAQAAGVELERLLWLRPTHLRPALAAAEIVLAGGLPLVIVELGLPPIPGGRGQEAAWLRLRRAAADHGAALLISAPYRVTGTAARTVLELEREPGAASALWLGRPNARPLLTGVRTRARLSKGAGRWQRVHEGSDDLELCLCPGTLAEPLRAVSSTAAAPGRAHCGSAVVGLGDDEPESAESRTGDPHRRRPPRSAVADPDAASSRVPGRRRARTAGHRNTDAGHDDRSELDPTRAVAG